MKEKKTIKRFKRKKKNVVNSKESEASKIKQKREKEKKGYIKQHPDISSSILLHCLRLYEEYSLI